MKQCDACRVSKLPNKIYASIRQPYLNDCLSFNLIAIHKEILCKYRSSRPSKHSILWIYNLLKRFYTFVNRKKCLHIYNSRNITSGIRTLSSQCASLKVKIFSVFIREVFHAFWHQNVSYRRVVLNY